MNAGNIVRWTLVATMAVLLCLLMYGTFREENARVQWLFGGLFALFGLYYWFQRKTTWSGWWQLFIAGLVLRLLIAGATPNLSNDYFRYSWDGYLIVNGTDPYEYTPEGYLERFPDDTTARTLLAEGRDGFRMNSMHYYTIYPTVNQLVFAAAYWLTGSPNAGNLVVIRLCLILSEVVLFFVLLRLLEARGRSGNILTLYWMNPLVIAEFTGNLHFDGVALMCMLLSLWYLEQKRVVSGAIALAAAVATKLNPVFMACVALRELKWKRWMLYGAVTGVTSVLMLAVFLNMHNYHHVKWSFRLYFYAFHFNSSSMNAIRGLFGRDAMEWAMGFFPNIIFIGIFGLNLLRKKWDLSDRVLLAYSIYYFLGTTVHPWYILTLLPFALLSDWKFPVVWTYLIVWTYSFYHVDGVEQIGWVVGLEYGILALFVFLDFRKRFISAANTPDPHTADL